MIRIVLIKFKRAKYNEREQREKERWSTAKADGRCFATKK